MNIDMPQNGRLEFRLDSRDLSELNISFEELDYSNVETRRVVWTLIDIARKSLHADFDLTGRMLVEVFPEKSGGCKLCITVLPKAEYNISVSAKPIFVEHIFEFSADDLIDLTTQIKKLPVRCDDGELFSNGEKYRLIVPLSEGQRNLKTLMYEYGIFRGSDEVALSHTREYWKPVISENALKSLVS